jgi:hypothetical protein
VNNKLINTLWIILSPINAIIGEISNMPKGGIIFLKIFKYGSQIAAKNSTIILFLICGTHEVRI